MKQEKEWNQFIADFGNLEDFINEKQTSELEQFYLKEDGMYFFFCRLPYSNIFSIDDVKIAYADLIKIIDKESCLYTWLSKEKKIY